MNSTEREFICEIINVVREYRPSTSDVNTSHILFLDQWNVLLNESHGQGLHESASVLIPVTFVWDSLRSEPAVLPLVAFLQAQVA